MFNIEKTNYGFRSYVEGNVTVEEAKEWYAKLEGFLQTPPSGEWGMFADYSKKNGAVAGEVQEISMKGQNLCKEKGITRSVVVLSSAIATMQLKKFAKETGIDKNERYIDASTITDWEEKAIAWLSSGKEPE